MSTFRIYFTQTASTSVEVEADDFDEAVELAYNDLPTGVCAQCSGWGSDRAGIELAGDWESDDTYYLRDGVGVEVSDR